MKKSSDTSSDLDCRRDCDENGDRFRLLAAGQFALLAATWPLWTSQTVFPQVPLISFAGRIPRSFEWSLLALLPISLGFMSFAKKTNIRRLACLLMGVWTFGLACIDQHRLQPWAWQFMILSVVFATASATMATAFWRWLVIGIYAWSAWSKMDHDFCVDHGPFLLDGFCKSIGLTNGIKPWPDPIRFGMAAAIPAFELLVAFGLCWRKTRIFAVVGAAIMHVSLLFALGPFGHGHQPGVLVWNVFFLVQNWWLFCHGRNRATVLQMDDSIRRGTRDRIGNSFAGLVVVAVMVWPLFEPFGLCDHWPAWAVYAAKPERVTVLLDEADVAKLPERMKRYLRTPRAHDDWYPLRLDRWSLDAVYAPIYPQDRFQVGVALGLARDFHLNQIQIVIESPANGWTGKRTVKQYAGLEAIAKLADSYRCNGRPR